MTDSISKNTKKLRHTFSRILPNLKFGENIVVFFCDTPPGLSLYSLAKGELICQHIIASKIISILMHLKQKGVPWNAVTHKDLSAIQKGYQHIESEELKENPLPDETIEIMKKELNEIFEKQYS